MMDFIMWLVLALGRASLALSISAVLVCALLWALNTRTAALHQIAWCVVLLQGWLLAGWSVELPGPERRPDSLSSVSTGTSLFSKINSPVSVREPASVPMRLPQRNHSAIWRPACWPLCLLAIWALGMVGIVARSLWQYWDFMRRLPDPQPAPADWVREWKQLLREEQVETDIPLWSIERLGPFLCWLPGGYRLVIPASIWRDLSPSQRTAVLRHEAAHARNHDVWKTLSVRLLALPHWFNPLAWWAVRSFDESVEWACDERVSRRSPHAVTDYARALLSLAKDSKRLSLTASAASGRGLVVRVRRLLSLPRMEDSRMKKGTIAVLLCVLCGLHVLRFELAADEGTAATPKAVPVGLDGASNATAVPKSQTATGQTATAQTAGREAVVDVNFLFKNLPEFKRKMDEVKQSIQKVEKELRFRKFQTEPLTERLTRVAADKEEYKAVELKLAKLHSKIKTMVVHPD